MKMAKTWSLVVWVAVAEEATAEQRASWQVDGQCGILLAAETELHVGVRGSVRERPGGSVGWSFRECGVGGVRRKTCWLNCFRGAVGNFEGRSEAGA